MKKILFIAIAAAALFVSCEKTPVGMTGTEPLAGMWAVTIDARFPDGSYAEDPYGLGTSYVWTYNTSSNSTTEMWVSDQGNFWEYSVKVPCSVDNLTFGSADWKQNSDYECGVLVNNGKIEYGTATTPSGVPADKIYFELAFDDDEPGMTYVVEGYRYTGFEADGIY